MSFPVLIPRGSLTDIPKILVNEETLLIGRETGCDVLLSQPTISRRHAKLTWDGHELRIEDLKSSGGTWLNDRRVQRTVVEPGDIVRLGPQVEFVASQQASGASLEKATSGHIGEEGVKHLQLVLDVARALNAATVLEEVLEVVLQAAVRLMRVDRGCVVLFGPDGSRSAAAVYPRNLSETAWGEQSSLLAQAVNERHTVCVGAKISPSTSMVLRGATMAVATPLLVARRPMGLGQDASFIATIEAIGGFVVERTKLGEVFSTNDLAVFETLAADAAAAIDGARLYRESREKSKIDHEMSLARNIQLALLRTPPEVPFASIYAYSQPARIVGGDLYHTALRSDGCLALALGDVSGKGIPAAMIMAMIQGLLSVFHDLGQPLSAIPGVLNHNLGLYNPGNRFLTIAMGILTPAGGLELVNAAHCSVIILRDNGDMELIDSGGPLIGILPEGQWEVRSLVLKPGDTVVVFSDGVTESFSPQGEEFGVAGVQAVLKGKTKQTPEEIATAINSAASTYRGGREADDDVTLMVVRYTGQ